MLVKFFKRGNGNTRNGSSVQNYLLNEERLANQTAQLLRGDPDLTTAIIDTLILLQPIRLAVCLLRLKKRSMSYKNKESWIVLSKHYCLHLMLTNINAIGYNTQIRADLN